MNKNNGKDGEMDAIILGANICKQHKNCDIIRHTKTNEPDLGVDLEIHATKKVFEEIFEVAGADSSLDLIQKKDKNMKARIDVKSTEGKIGLDIVQKFVADVRKSPDCVLHILAGGKELTKPADVAFVEAKNILINNKALVYLDEKQLAKLNAYYVDGKQRLEIKDKK